ncbi:TerB family tellurite resistance protein [Henriciella litoralis]|uniref:TerB family tellurite resistance protein n=1 Tax=Henriciella litoralis TaxID=568102 RepID=UPI000A06F3F9|nr:TerB family tellurite resistance protein [Henriciella litoralis]
MHILLALMGIATFIAVWYWRLKMLSGAARHGLDAAKGAANLPRKLSFQHKARKGGLSVVSDPREAATVMMLEIARARGAVTAAQENAIIQEIRSHFGFDEAAATELIAQAGWLSRQAPAPHAVMARMSDVVLNTPDMTMKDFDDLASMLENVAVADGNVSTIERDLIQVWRRKSRLN